MSVVRVGSSGTYATGWDHIFGGSKGKTAAKKGGKKAAKKGGKQAAAKPAAKKRAVKAAPGKKPAAGKKTGRKR
jgi:hypothetical protein